MSEELVKACKEIIDCWDSDYIVARYGEGKDALCNLRSIIEQDSPQLNDRKQLI